MKEKPKKELLTNEEQQFKTMVAAQRKYIC